MSSSDPRSRSTSPANGGSTSNRQTDSRTQFPSRDQFYQEVAPLIEANTSDSSFLALVVLDVDGLDFILKTFGPTERDRVIRDVGHRIQEASNPDKTPYHITQGRFVLALPDSTYQSITRLSRTLIEAFKPPFEVSGVPYHLQAFVGISNYPSHAQNINELVRTSVFACYQARETETRIATFDQATDQEARRRFYLMLDLEQALEKHDEIQLAYQPLLDLKSRHCIGVEGLCRWQHPKEGQIPPGNFLPFVEQTPLMMPLTEATLSLGLRDLSEWQEKGFKGSLAINLSTTVFRHPDMQERLMNHFRFCNMGMEQVHFEVTETGIMDQPNRAVHTLETIRNNGSKIAVDDFGTGHSSLAYLADLPVDILKIDKYFVQNLSTPWGKAIVGAAVALAQQLNLTTVAEGIEDEFQFNQCINLGVDVGQGFYIARPMLKEQLERWLFS